MIVTQTIPLSKESKESFDERSELAEAKSLVFIHVDALEIFRLRLNNTSSLRSG